MPNQHRPGYFEEYNRKRRENYVPKPRQKRAGNVVIHLRVAPEKAELWKSLVGPQELCGFIRDAVDAYVQDLEHA